MVVTRKENVRRVQTTRVDIPRAVLDALDELYDERADEVLSGYLGDAVDTEDYEGVDERDLHIQVQREA